MLNNITVLLLLCAVVIGTRLPNMFDGCVENPDNRRPTPGSCTLLTQEEFRGNKTYLTIAGSVMRTYAYQPPARFLQTVFALTRAAFVHPPDNTPRGFFIVEFLTARSNCSAPGAYSVTRCKPSTTKVDMICQGMYFLFEGISTHRSSWCVPLR